MGLSPFHRPNNTYSSPLDAGQKTSCALYRTRVWLHQSEPLIWSLTNFYFLCRVSESVAGPLYKGGYVQQWGWHTFSPLFHRLCYWVYSIITGELLVYILWLNIHQFGLHQIKNNFFFFSHANVSKLVTTKVVRVWNFIMFTDQSCPWVLYRCQTLVQWVPK